MFAAPVLAAMVTGVRTRMGEGTFGLGKAEPDHGGTKQGRLYRYFVIALNSSTGPRCSRASGPMACSRQWSI